MASSAARLRRIVICDRHTHKIARNVAPGEFAQVGYALEGIEKSKAVAFSGVVPPELPLLHFCGPHEYLLEHFDPATVLDRLPRHRPVAAEHHPIESKRIDG